jgi:hypothetical protein
LLLGDCEQRGPDPPALEGGCDVQLLDPAVRERDEADNLFAGLRYPDRCLPEERVVKLSPVLVGVMEFKQESQLVATGRAPELEPIHRPLAVPPDVPAA